ncbi:MAG: dihydroorotase family protein [Candidatus Altiarchaeota archaeon]
MKKVDLVLDGGRIYYKGEFVDAGVAVEDGKIVKVARNASLPKADERIDAGGLYVMPGAIDVHVHVRDLKQKSREDWKSASEAAAAGGVTTILAMPNTNPPLSSAKAVTEYARIAAKKSIVDYGVYIGATGKNRDEITKANQACAVKVYMASTTGDLLVDDDILLTNSFASANKAKKIACVHAEDEAMIKARTAAVKRKGREVTPEMHSVIRDGECARKAVEKALQLSGKAKNKLHICHVSTRAEMELIADAKKKGLSVSCEVAPHHLFLSEKDYDKTNRLKVNPPLRSKTDVSTMWSALQEGVVDCVASDHAPHLLSEKEEDYWNAPAGVPGLETTLPLMLDSAVKRMLDVPQVIKLTSENPAKLFGLSGKGAIKEGFDADFALIDFRKSWRIRGDGLKSRCAWTPFEGRVVQGVPVMTVVRGKTVYRDGDALPNKGAEVGV